MFPSSCSWEHHSRGGDVSVVCVMWWRRGSWPLIREEVFRDWITEPPSLLHPSPSSSSPLSPRLFISSLYIWFFLFSFHVSFANVLSSSKAVSLFLLLLRPLPTFLFLVSSSRLRSGHKVGHRRRHLHSRSCRRFPARVDCRRDERLNLQIKSNQRRRAGGLIPAERWSSVQRLGK